METKISSNITKFIKENYAISAALKPKSGMYSYSKENVKQWIECMETNYSAHEKINNFSRLFAEYITYISFDQMMEDIEEEKRYIIEKLEANPNHKVIVVIPEEMSKSNMWISILLLNDERILNRINYITDYIIDYDPTDKNKPLTNTIFIHPDDMSYSGRQLLGSLRGTMKGTEAKQNDNHKIKLTQDYINNGIIYIVAVCYLGGDAFNNYLPNKGIGTCIKFPKNIKVFKTMTEIYFEEYGTKEEKIAVENGKCHYTKSETIYSLIMELNKVQSAYDATAFETEMNRVQAAYNNGEDEELDPSKYTSTIAEMLTFSTSAIPIYFDHKLADGLSIFMSLFSFLPCTKESIYGHIIPECRKNQNLNEQKQILFNNSGVFTQVTDFDSEKDRCPTSYYKLINYTYEGRSVNKKLQICDFLNQ